MQITFLGHAGFLVETAESIVVADPWLSRSGAFDSAWMQLPQNHHMASLVRQKLQDPSKERFVYISHEHRDHFDPEFLESIQRRDFTILVGKFGRPFLRELLAGYGCKELIACEDGRQIPLAGGGYLRVLVEDSGLNRDSALLVRAEGQAFLDLNDCKIHDRLRKVLEQDGPVDVFAAQFSGAIWHPPCYQYEAKQYETISRKKMFSKFEAVARALDVVRPRVFLASAGPAAFLDPMLQHINFQPLNIFPRAPKFFAYVEKRLKDCTTRMDEPMPGDVLDAASGRWLHQVPERLGDENFKSYIEGYAERMKDVFEARHRNLSAQEMEIIFVRLAAELQRKLEALSLNDRVGVPLYMSLAERPELLLRVDFPGRRVDAVTQITDDKRYTFQVRASDIVRVLDGHLTWEEYLLSLRMQISRIPDDYDAVLHGYLAVEAQDLPGFCDAVRRAESRQERTIVEADGKRYSVQRFCPHQGADLSAGWVEGGRYLTCPRHRWQFDLEQGGKCTMNATTIHCLPVLGNEAEEKKPEPPPAGEAASA